MIVASGAGFVGSDVEPEAQYDLGCCTGDGDCLID